MAHDAGAGPATGHDKTALAVSWMPCPGPAANTCQRHLGLNCRRTQVIFDGLREVLPSSSLPCKRARSIRCREEMD